MNIGFVEAYEKAVILNGAAVLFVLLFENKIPLEIGINDS